MATRIVTVDDVKTVADVNRLLAQDCVDAAGAIALCTVLTGAWAFPIAIKRWTRAIPIAVEYKTCVGVMTSLVLAYYAAVHTKERCEVKLKKLIREKHNMDV